MNAKRAFSGSDRNGGFAIVSGIFLLVVLAALGAFMVTISTTQNITSAQDIQGSRAYWAAKGGIQWAAASITTTPGCPLVQPVFGDGFDIVVACVANTYTEGVTSETIYWVSATASTGGAVGSPTYVERQVQVFIQ
jgi:MSHA biogenesis protein MshP